MNRMFVCAFIFQLGGCGGDGGGSIDVDDLGMELAVASCALQFECCTDAEIMEQYMGITFEGHAIETEAQCVEFSNAVFVGFAVTGYKESIAKDRVAYDGSAAADCVAAIEALSCSQYNEGDLSGLEGCRPYLSAKVENGGGCTEDYECTSANCVGEDTPLGEPPTDGACMPMPAAGEACDDNCPGELICDADLGSGDETCRPARTNGTQCNLDSQCASGYCEPGSSRVCADEPPRCVGA